MAQSFGQVINVLGPNVGFPGNYSRTTDTIIEARVVLASTATNLPFGAGAVLISGSGTGGSWQSFADFLATASNVQYLQQYFAGIAVRNVKTMQPYSVLNQNLAPAITTTATASSGGTVLTVTSATGLQVGQAVEGAGIQANSTVTAISGTAVTISLQTLAALSGTNVSFTGTLTPGIGYYAAGTEGEVLVRSSVSVIVNGTGTPQANAPVYVRTVANANIPGTSVGDFEAASDLATSSITITTTLGSTALTTSAATGLAIGQSISAVAGVGANNFLAAGAGTSWTLSQPATAAVTTAAASFYNTYLLGSVADPWIVFRTGQIDVNNVAEVLIKSRHA